MSRELVNSYLDALNYLTSQALIIGVPSARVFFGAISEPTFPDSHFAQAVFHCSMYTFHAEHHLSEIDPILFSPTGIFVLLGILGNFAICSRWR